jgi:hypothetical protein
MAPTKLPDPLERRHLIEKELSDEQALAIAEAYLEDGRVDEAVVFFGKAQAGDRLQELADKAVESGDAFLLTEVSRVRRQEPAPEVWERLAEAARRAGKDLYAETAERQAHRGDD